MHVYDTVSEAIDDLKKRGYTKDFNLEYDCLTCSAGTGPLRPEEFSIVELYRFEGNTDPADEAVVYAIESRHGDKGVLVNGFGPSADPASEEMIEKLKVMGH